MKATKEQEKWGAMTALLSLDAVFPFYEYMGLKVTAPKQFKQLLRNCILEHREEFNKNPRQIPDLKQRVLEKLEVVYGANAAKALERWYWNSFVWFIREDYGDYNAWDWFFMYLFNHKDKLEKLKLPDEVMSVLEDKYNKDAIMREPHPLKKELLELADKVDEKPHSKWDIEIYVRHGFDDYDSDPFGIGVMAVIYFRRFKAFLKWLFAQLDETQRQEFLESANIVNKLLPEAEISEELVIPKDIDRI